MDVDVTLDATGLTAGDYPGAIFVFSDDLDESLSEVPVLLHVQPPLETTMKATPSGIRLSESRFERVRNPGSCV